VKLDDLAADVLLGEVAVLLDMFGSSRNRSSRQFCLILVNDYEVDLDLLTLPLDLLPDSAETLG